MEKNEILQNDFLNELFDKLEEIRRLRARKEGKNEARELRRKVIEDNSSDWNKTGITIIRCNESMVKFKKGKQAFDYYLKSGRFYNAVTGVWGNTVAPEKIIDLFKT